MTAIAATGHRPPRLGLGYDAESNRMLTQFAEIVLSEWRDMAEEVWFSPIQEIVSGMAQGWDQAVAHATVNIGLPLTCAIPFEGQESKWPTDAQRRYKAILAKANRVHVVCPGGYAPHKMILRDEWMVDRATHITALWDGTKTGGTWHTVNYAGEKGRTLINCWDRWIAFKGA